MANGRSRLMGLLPERVAAGRSAALLRLRSLRRERAKATTYIIVCGPTGEKQHGTLVCPWHRVPEEATYRDEEWYGRYGTMACGARLMGDEWWRPEGMSRREFNRLDREVRPEHYARYDARRGDRGRFISTAPASTDGPTTGGEA